MAGRKKKQWLSYFDAQLIVQDECLQSRNIYYSWWDRNRPKGIPKYPYRVYLEEWTSWNDFLGNDNRTGMELFREWRPYHEAIVFAHSLRIPTMTEWIEYAQAGKLPSDIPGRPDAIYEDWVSWKQWLGNRPAEKVDAIQKAAGVALLYVGIVQGRPGGIIKVGVAKGGESELGSLQQKFQFRAIGKYRADPKVDWKNIVESFGSVWEDYRAVEGEYLCRNVNELMFELSCQLDIVR